MTGLPILPDKPANRPARKRKVSESQRVGESNHVCAKITTGEKFKRPCRQKRD